MPHLRFKLELGFSAFGILASDEDLTGTTPSISNAYHSLELTEMRKWIFISNLTFTM
jgi:hypothetical protein